MKMKPMTWWIIGVAVLGVTVSWYWLFQTAQAWEPNRPKIARVNDDRFLYVQPGTEVTLTFEKPIEPGRGGEFYRSWKQPWTIVWKGKEMTAEELLKSEEFKNASPDDKRYLQHHAEQGRQYERERARRLQELGGEEAVKSSMLINDPVADSWWDVVGHQVKKLTSRTLQIVLKLSPGEINFIEYKSPEHPERLMIGIVGAGDPDMDATVTVEPLPSSGEVPTQGNVKVFLKEWKVPDTKTAQAN